MSNSFAEQLIQHREMILAERGVMITYKQGEIVIENIPAVPSKSGFWNEKNGERRTKFIEREYTVEFALLKCNGVQIVPKQNDRIIECDSVYEVVPGESKQCYRPVDVDEMYVRIFTQKIGKKALKQ